jgi:hypothetical protein
MLNTQHDEFFYFKKTKLEVKLFCKFLFQNLNNNFDNLVVCMKV